MSWKPFNGASIGLIIGLVLWCGCKPNNALPDPLEAGWEGKKVCQVLEDNKHIRVLKCTFEPGTGHERHFHSPHFGYTLSEGTFRIRDTTGTREVDIPQGYTFTNDRIEWHEVLNIGETTSEYLIIEYK